jgi:hypothetical protein
MAMEMKCNECGGTSPMGAIFCRECGEKLDIDTMEPKVTSKATDGGFKFSKLAIRRLISLCISIIIFGSIGMLFVNDAPELPEEVDKDSITIVSKTFGFITNDKNKNKVKNKKYKFEEDALTYFMQDTFLERQDTQEGDAMTYNNCVFDFYDENMIKIDLQATMVAVGISKEISMQMIFSFENDDDGVVFTIVSAKHGMIPVPEFAQEKLVTSRYERLVPGDDDIYTLIERFKSIKILNSDTLEIQMK